MTIKMQQGYSICDIISSKIQKRRRQKKLNMIYFVLKFTFNFLADVRVQIRFCGWKSLKLSVTRLTRRATINCNCFLYGACVNPGSVKVST